MAISRSSVVHRMSLCLCVVAIGLCQETEASGTPACMFSY